MKGLLVSFASGCLFAVGLGISGMTRPMKVIGFLDFAGNWDASLAFVIAGGIAVYFAAYRLTRRRFAPLLANKFSVPERRDIDLNLIVGAAIFGTGWGLGGFCPGPAITSLASGSAPIAVFVVSMAVGIYLHSMLSGLSAFRMRPFRNPVQIATDCDA